MSSQLSVIDCKHFCNHYFSQALHESLYRVETGNYDYRYISCSSNFLSKCMLACFCFFYFCWHVLQVYDLNCSVAWGIMQPFLIWVWCRVVLRCRQLARERFAKLRSDVLVKLELLDQKHGESLCIRISLFVLCNFGTTLGKDWGHFLPFFTQCSLG